MSQFCEKKTPEEAKKEMEELTKKELMLLTQKILDNPNIIKPKMNYESSDDSDSDSSISSNTSSSSSYKHKKHHSIPVLNKQSLNIFKKEQTIDKLEEKNYFKTLELSNAILEKTRLEEENRNIRKRLIETEAIVKIISDIIELSKKELIKVNGSLKKDNITFKMLNLQKEYDSELNLMNLIKNNLNNISDSTIKIHYLNQLLILEKKLMDNYQENNKLIDTFIIGVRNNEKIEVCLLSLFVCLMFSIFVTYMLKNFV